MQRVSIKAVLQALLVGLGAATAFAVSGFALASHVLVSAFITPGALVIAVFGRFIPSSITYSIFPEGGGPAFFGFSFLLSMLFWICAFALLFSVARQLRATRKA